MKHRCDRCDLRNETLIRIYAKYLFKQSTIQIRQAQTGSMKASHTKVPLRSLLLLLLLVLFADALKHSKKPTHSDHPSPKPKHNTQHKESIEKAQSELAAKHDQDQKSSVNQNSDELQNSNKEAEPASPIEQPNKARGKQESEEVESEEQKQKDEEQQEEQNKSQDQDSEEKIAAAAKSKRKSKSKSQHFQKQQNGSQPKGEQNSERSYLFYLAIYAFVLIAITLVIKIKAQQSFAAALIDRFLDITWYGIVKNYFNKSQGYDAPSYDEDERNHEYIDHGDSVTVGYSENQGRDLFWEKNSVEGI